MVPAVHVVHADRALVPELARQADHHLVGVGRSDLRVDGGIHADHRGRGPDGPGGPAVGKEPVPDNLQRLPRRLVRRARGVHGRALVPEAVVRLAAGRRRRVGDLRVEHPDVAPVAEVGNPRPAAVQVPGHAETRAEGRVVADLVAALVLRAVLVVAQAEVHREPVVHAPDVVHERGVSREVIAHGVLEDGAPVDVRGGGGGRPGDHDRVDVVADNGGFADLHAVAAGHRVLVVHPHLVEVVEANHEIMGTRALRREEVVQLDVEVVVVLPVDGVVAHRAVGGRVEAGPAQPVPDRRAPDEVRVLGAGARVVVPAARVLGVEEQAVGRDPLVVRRHQRFLVLVVVQARRIHDGAETVVRVVDAPIEVRELEVVAGGQRVGRLPFQAGVVGRVGVVVARVGHRPVRLIVLVAPRREEPELVLEDRPAEGHLVGGHHLIDVRVARERRQRLPAVVDERRPEGPGEAVAARLRDHVDHAALEPAVLRRDVAGRDLGLLHGVLDVERTGLLAQVLVHVDAVDQVEVVVGQRARDHDVAAGAVADRGRRHDRRGVQRAPPRDVLDGRRLERGRHRRRHRRLGGGARHRDRLRHGGHRQLHVHREGIGHLQADRLFDRRETLELEGHRVVTRGQERDDVVAVGRRHDGTHALQHRRGRGHGDARQHQTVRVRDVAGDGARGIALGKDGAGQCQERQREDQRSRAHDRASFKVLGKQQVRLDTRY